MNNNGNPKTICAIDASTNSLAFAIFNRFSALPAVCIAMSNSD